MHAIVPVVLAGGSGTRLWPLSRDLYPKQLIPLPKHETMLQSTLSRLAGLEGVAAPIVIGNEKTRFMTAEQLRVMGISPAAIILEPVGRNTAPAVAVAALRTQVNTPEALLLVLPADHYIEHPGRFREVLTRAVPHARKGRLITFGILPTTPETGYGYIRKGAPLSEAAEDAFAIDRFVEKPDLATAETYLASGEYLWNSGMFLFRADIVLAELEAFAPDMVAACRKAVEAGVSDLDFFRLDREAFTLSPSDSIDYAVMEKTDRGAVIPLDAGWNDLGSWEALWQVGKKDENENVVKGDILIHDVKNSYLHGESRLVAAVGLSDHIVVETADAVLIAPRDRVQDVKKLVERLKTAKRPESATHRTVYRPWGSSETIHAAARFDVKRLTVKPGARISLQKHFNRAEHWIIVNGSALVKKGEDQFLLKEDESTYIPAGMLHRLENPGKMDLELIEIRTGSYLGEDDIDRIEDDYGRHDEDQ